MRSNRVPCAHDDLEVAAEVEPVAEALQLDMQYTGFGEDGQEERGEGDDEGGDDEE